MEMATSKNGSVGGPRVCEGCCSSAELEADVSLGCIADIAVCKNGATLACTSCQQGWQGANCDACMSDQVCKASLGDAAATCNTGFAYTK